MPSFPPAARFLRRTIVASAALVMAMIWLAGGVTRPVAAQAGAPNPPTLYSPPNGGAESSTAVTLIWSSDTGATAYYVRYLDGPTGTWVLVYTGNSAYITLTNFSPGYQYWWVAYTCNNVACVQSSSEWWFTVIIPPQQAAPEFGAAVATTSPTLGWYAAAGQVAYYFVGYKNTVDQVYYQTGNVSGTSIGLSGLTPGYTYLWAVYACDSAGYCDGSSSWDQFTVLLPPQQTSPSNGGVDPTLSPALFWNADPGAVTYYAGYYDLNVPSPPTDYTGDVSGSSVTLPTLVFGHAYAWNVFACIPPGNAIDCTESATWIFTAANGAPAPPILGSPAAGATGVGATPLLSWQASAGAVSGTTYNVGMADVDTFTVLHYGSTTGLSFQVPSGWLVYGLSYWWNVYACNDSACGGWGAMQILSTAPPPGVFPLTTPGNFAMNTGTAPLTLTWGAPANAVPGSTRYVPYVYDPVAGTATWGNTAWQYTTSAVVTSGLVMGRSYIWTVAACTDQACVTWEAGNLFTTSPGAGVAPESSPWNGQTAVGTAPQLAWQQAQSADYPGVTHYFAYVWDDQLGGYVQPNYDAGTATAYQLSGLTLGHTYQWTTEACNGWPDAFDCTIDPTWYSYATTANTAPAAPYATTTLYVTETNGNHAFSAGFGSRHANYGFIALDFGRPWCFASTCTAGVNDQDFGTLIHDNASTPIHLSDVTQVVEQFILGYYSANPLNPPPETFVIGTNNGQFAQNFLTIDAGKKWADVVNGVRQWIRNPGQNIPDLSAVFFVTGGADIENDKSGGWGDPTATRGWIVGYLDNGGPAYYDYGDCAGCPQASQTQCNNPSASSCTIANTDLGCGPNPQLCTTYDKRWHVQDYYYVAYAYGQAAAIPEIYNRAVTGNSLAQEWAGMYLYGILGSGTAGEGAGGFAIPGAITECGAEVQKAGIAPNATSAKPAEGWTALWHALHDGVYAYTRFIPAQSLTYSTDIAYEDHSGSLGSYAGCYS